MTKGDKIILLQSISALLRFNIAWEYRKEGREDEDWTPATEEDCPLDKWREGFQVKPVTISQEEVIEKITNAKGWVNPQTSVDIREAEGWRYLVPEELDGRWGRLTPGSLSNDLTQQFVAQIWTGSEWLDDMLMGRSLEFTYRIQRDAPLPITYYQRKVVDGWDNTRRIDVLTSK